MKISLACGDRKPEGFIGLDIADIPSVDIVCDILEYPWPLEDECAEEVHCEHFIEHVPAKLRPGFANELYRILKPGGKVTLIFPSGTSSRAFMDITHEWPPVVPQSFYYWSKDWRESQKLTHGPYAEWKCNFGFECQGSQNDDFVGRADDVIRFAEMHYWNAIDDYCVTLFKITDAEPIAQSQTA